MARINVYLPDALATRARAAQLNVSAITQDAIRRTLSESSTDAWLETLRPSVPTGRVPHDRALEALDAARSAAPTRHG